MIKEILLITLLLSVVFISGCVQQPTVTGEATAEGQAMKAIEQEMEEIENAIIEQ